jgi:transglutaminase-like putative cysteine protease
MTPISSLFPFTGINYGPQATPSTSLEEKEKAMNVVSTPENAVVLSISHRTEYRYSGPVRFGPHRLVLRPRESHNERILSMELTTFPESSFTWHQDIHGNIVATAEFQQHSNQLVIQSDFTISKTPLPEWSEDPGSQGGEDYPVYYAGIEEAASQIFRRSGYPPEVEAIRNWVRSLNILPIAGERSPILTGLAQGVHQQVGYRRREEPGVHSPVDTLNLRSGSCRDTAVLMMEAARSVGFASRFVSGYLESSGSNVGRGSTHAWVEIYLPDRGWVGYDPSIGKPVGPGHIPVAVSHHPRGVMPVSGRFDSLGNSYLGLTVGIQSSRITPSNATY